MNRQYAFTLVELMVTLAVFGITLMIAVPSFMSISQSNRTASDTNSLVGALNYARSEAVKRGDYVSVCASKDGQTCTNSAWQSGWIVFVNSANSSPAAVAAPTDILRVYGATSKGSAVSSLGQFITFKPGGSSSLRDQFVMCDSTGAGSARKIDVSLIGRISLKTGGGTCNAS